MPKIIPPLQNSQEKNEPYLKNYDDSLYSNSMLDPIVKTKIRQQEGGSLVRPKMNDCWDTIIQTLMRPRMIIKTKIPR